MARFLLVAAMACVASLAWGAEPDKISPLPAPQKEAPQAETRRVYYRVSAYEVWQNYGVDRFGRFRPVVIYSPYGSYYRATGLPFPWVETHTRDFVPVLAHDAVFGESPEEVIVLTDPKAFMPYAED